jgi:NAD+ diphosphatase
MPPRPDLGPKPLLGYTASILARVAERRTDMAFLAACEADQRAGTFAIGGELVVLKKGRNGADPLFRPDEARALAPTAESVFLGLCRRCRGASASRSIPKPPRRSRDIPISSSPICARLPCRAWSDRSTSRRWPRQRPCSPGMRGIGFCANCGAPTNVSQAGWKRECSSCKVEHFPRTDPVVIMLAIDGDKCLLGRAGRFVANMWSCLAGFVEPGESIEEAARRETLEEAGIVCGEVKYFRSQPWPFPMSLMIGCHARATNSDIKVDREELEDARWFTRDETALMFVGRHPEGISIPPPIAIAHHIIRAWVEEGDGVFG